MNLLKRLQALGRGLLAHWLRGRETANPAAVYEAAIEARIDQYAELRKATAGILYLREKLDGELGRRAAELARVRLDLEQAIARDDDSLALTLIPHRDGLANEVARLTHELDELTTEVEAAKQNLIQFQDEILWLREEKTRMLSRLASAKARLRFQETLHGLRPDAEIQALEAVREQIRQMVSETRLVAETSDSALEGRLDRIRQDETLAAARTQLAEMKRTRLTNAAAA